ncbi:hypothetical protein ACFL27_00320 [candidate division CSSED10-310 bacterium]|uniref:non-specific serine/threonine protein kinase n=1 Tax=candidate division CSSED10-310 bacterium TaxID=2855610 RepID=A0ABV6YQZ5_UNCC1
MGTPFYMSPEQVRGRVDRIDFYSDIWAVGVILYECATLVRPFDADKLQQLGLKILKEEPVLFYTRMMEITRKTMKTRCHIETQGSLRVKCIHQIINDSPSGSGSKQCLND